MKRILTLALATTTLIGLGACSSDTKLSVSNATDASELSTSSDLSISSDLSLPSDLNLSEECQAITMAFAGMMAQVFAPTGQAGDIEKVFGDVSSKVPDDLKDDVTVVAEAFGKYAQIMNDNANDMTNPNVQAAIEDLGTPEVQAASDNVQAYFDAGCSEG